MTPEQIFELGYKTRNYFDMLRHKADIEKAETIQGIDSVVFMMKMQSENIEIEDRTDEYRRLVLSKLEAFINNRRAELERAGIELEETKIEEEAEKALQ